MSRSCAELGSQRCADLGWRSLREAEIRTFKFWQCTDRQVLAEKPQAGGVYRQNDRAGSTVVGFHMQPIEPSCTGSALRYIEFKKLPIDVSCEFSWPRNRSFKVGTALKSDKHIEFSESKANLVLGSKRGSIGGTPQFRHG